MKINVAKSAGFCFGVKRACDMAYSLLPSDNLYLLGELIHNGRVMADLTDKGARVIESISQAPDGATVLIRAHGVAKSVIDEMEKRNIKYYDATCPYVKKIHGIVSKENEKGQKIIIFGKKNHPEVVSISGWCSNAIVTMDFDEIVSKIDKNDHIAVVAQTTTEMAKFYNFIKFLKKACNYVLVFDTICQATLIRQEETVELASESDLMIIIGGHKSSNTLELYNKSKAVQENTILVEDSEIVSLPEKVKNFIYRNINIGVTAGASTPSTSIEEVIAVMEDEKILITEELGTEELTTTESVNEEAVKESVIEEAPTVELTSEEIGNSEFEKELENYLVSPVHTGRRVTGTVEQITETEVRINIPGYKGVGIIPDDELSDDNSVKPADLVKIGDTVSAIVIKPNDLEGFALLSKKRIDSVLNMAAIKEAFETQETIEGKVVSVIKGGILVSVKAVRIFVPASLASLRYVQDLNSLLNKIVKLKIIEFDEEKNRATGSVKIVMAAEQKVLEDAFWATAEEGKTYNGTIKSLTSFGAFADIGGVDGLIHITELSWGRIKHPSEVLNVGQEVEVYIKSLDKEKRKISLGYKKDADNPWLTFDKNYVLNDVVECRIVRIVPFGAFAEIVPGIDGLIHISQIANKHIAKPEDELSVGKVVTAKIIELDIEKKKISLSMRELLDEGERKPAEAEAVEAVVAVAEEAVVEEVASAEPAEAMPEVVVAEEPAAEVTE